TDASHLKTKPFGLGGSVLLALKSESSFELLIHKRSSDIGTYPNARAVVPNFGMEPIANNVCQRTKGNQILLYNFLKEYLEELFNFEELINQASNKKVNPFWFYDNSKEAKNVLSAIDKGTIEFIFLGFGFDCLNGVPIMSFLALVNDDEVINDIKTKAELNWEGKQIDFVNLGNKIHLLEEWLKDNQYHPGAAFTISRAQAFLGKHM
ncbi:MAG: hypothetical protein KAS23_03135, partial [Anaerohalosphaera sp.]|nr:hypothetical protein [Anaerohalosphaera sp.]